MNQKNISLFTIAALAGLAFTAAAAPVALPTTGPDPVPKSVFVSDIKLGKDPFFPNTKRGKEIPQANPHRQPDPDPETAVIAPPPAASSYLALKGILGADGRGLALINSSVKNYEFLLGESVTIKIPNHQDQNRPRSITVKCTEINANSVTVEVSDGDKIETKSLTLKKTD